jgi:L-lactate dehydrogenase complex protein LldG
MNGPWLTVPLQKKAWCMSSQEAFLARVRRALYRDAVPPSSRPPLWWSDTDVAEAAAQLQMRLAAQRPALIAQVQQELDAAGGLVAHVHSASEVVAYITHLAQQKDAHLVVRWQSELLEALEVDDALHQQGITVHTTALPRGTVAEEASSTVAMTTRRQELREWLARADLGLSGVDYVIAETGTLVLMAQAGQMRGVSLLPPVHVAIARISQVIATLADYLLLAQAAGADPQQYLTSCVSFVTGPSRTGDIELKLTVGVHGPGELHLLVLDDGNPK